MNHLIQAESLKLRTVPLPRLMLVLAALGAGMIAFVVVHTAKTEHTAVSLSNLATAAAAPLWFLAVVVAVLASAGEFQHRTIQLTLLQTPRRGRLLAAKTMVAAGYGAIITLLGTICGIAAGLVSLKINGMPVGTVDPQVLGTIAASVAIGAAWAVLALGLGMLTRSTAIALVTLLLWRFVLEGVMPSLMRDPGLARWLPSRAADAVLFGRANLLQPWTGALLLAGYATVVLCAAVHAFRRWQA
jgi:ABC-2 type transport system permease protein